MTSELEYSIHSTLQHQSSPLGLRAPGLSAPGELAPGLEGEKTSPLARISLKTEARALMLSGRMVLISMGSLTPLSWNSPRLESPCS